VVLFMWVKDICSVVVIFCVLYMLMEVWGVVMVLFVGRLFDSVIVVVVCGVSVEVSGIDRLFIGLLVLMVLVVLVI